MPPRRRISYIIPPPTEPVPLLRLPPPGTHHAGSSQPLLIPASSSPSSSSRRHLNGHSPHEHEHGHHTHHHGHHPRPSHDDAGRTRAAGGGDDLADVHHPRHRLGVMALALDTTTVLEGSDAPEGILYTGGRDGMVVAWDLGLPLRKRSPASAAPWMLEPPVSPPLSASLHSGVNASERGTAKRRRKDRWEVLTGMAEDGDGAGEDGSEDEEGHARYQSGDVLGEVKESLRWRGRSAGGTQGRRRAGMVGELNLNGGEAGHAGEEEDVPWEMRWELDGGRFQDGTPSRFRMSAQTHTDWVNDIVLCNYNQTVVSASSDGTVKAWNPHSSTPQDPITLGAHADYARCLAVCREQNWVASGSFDRTIKLWDLTRSAPPNPNASQSPTSPSPSPHQASALSVPTPLLTLNPPDATSPKGSVYALGCDPYGRVIASGSPERVVRLWDPRSGKRTGKLVGHTDNIRAVVVSEDGRYLLTGSADASIKLWSLASQRCLHTFAHHADSVWALHSTHPALERFVSGDRAGIVCLVDVRGAQGDMAEGTACVVCVDAGGCPTVGNEDGARAVSPNGGRVAGAGAGMGAQMQESTGINALLMLDDGLLWTASGGSSSVKRWRVPVPEDAEGEIGAGGGSSPRAMSHERERTVTSGTGGSAGLSGRKRSGSGGVGQAGHGEEEWDARNILSINRHRSPSPQAFALSSQQLPSQPYAHVPLAHQIQLASPMATSSSAFLHHMHAGGSRFARDSDVATLYSAASVVSVPGTGAPRSPLPIGFGHGHAHTPPAYPGLSPVNELNSRSPRHSFSPSLFASQSGAFDVLGANGGGMAALASGAQPYAARPDLTIKGSAGLVRAVLLNNRMHALTVDTRGEVACWDVVRGICVGRWAVADVRAAWAAKQQHGGGLNGDAEYTAGEVGAGMGMELETSPRDALEVVRERIEGEASVPVWTKIDTKTGALNVHLEDGGRSFDAEVYADEAGYSSAKGEEVRYNIGKWVLRNLFLGFIREEQRGRRKQREHDSPRSPGPTSPSASSLSLQIPPGHQGLRHTPSDGSMQIQSHPQPGASGHISGPATPTFMPAHQAHGRPFPGPSGTGTISGTVTTSPNARAPIPAAIPRTQHRAAGPLLTPMIPIAALKGAGPGVGLTTIPQSPSPGELATPMAIPMPPMTAPANVAGGGGGTPGATVAAGASAVTTNATTGQAGAQPVTTDYFTARARRPSTASNGLPPLTTNTTGGSGGNSSSTGVPGTNPTANTSADDFSAWGGPGSSSAAGGGQVPVTPTTPSAGAGLRGLLKNFTKTGKKTADTAGAIGLGTGAGNGTGAATPGSPMIGKDKEKEGEDPPEVKSPLQALLSSPLSPPSSSEAPTLALPHGLSVLVSDEVYCGWQTVYRGTAAGTWADVATLEETLPLWLLEYLLLNRVHTQPAVKLSFVLLPWANGESGEKALPELLNTAQSKLTASKLLRVRKLTHHVQDKLEKLSGNNGTPTSGTTPDPTPPMSPTPSMVSMNATTSARQHRHRAEEMYEILCNDIVLPLDMTLATVRQYYWRQSGELIMHYRLRARDARQSTDALAP